MKLGTFPLKQTSVKVAFLHTILRIPFERCQLFCIHCIRRRRTCVTANMLYTHQMLLYGNRKWNCTKHSIRWLKNGKLFSLVYSIDAIHIVNLQTLKFAREWNFCYFCWYFSRFFCFCIYFYNLKCNVKCSIFENIFVFFFQYLCEGRYLN